MSLKIINMGDDMSGVCLIINAFCYDTEEIEYFSYKTTTMIIKMVEKNIKFFQSSGRKES